MTPSPNAMVREVIVPELCEESADICKGAVPRAGSKVSTAFGATAVAADTVTVFVVVEVNPALSVKVNFTRNVPAEVYECVAATAFDVAPSPKEIDRETMFPDPAAELAEESADTCNGAVPDCGVTDSKAFGDAAGVDPVIASATTE